MSSHYLRQVMSIMYTLYITDTTQESMSIFPCHYTVNPVCFLSRSPARTPNHPANLSPLWRQRRHNALLVSQTNTNKQLKLTIYSQHTFSRASVNHQDHLHNEHCQEIWASAHFRQQEAAIFKSVALIFMCLSENHTPFVTFSLPF